MEVNDLRRVLAVHEHGSFAKAATALNMAQPSLSKAISRLERELGVRIFERDATGCELTPIGELLVARGRGLVAQAGNLMREASLIANGEAGQLRIGVGTPLRQPFLARLLPALTTRHERLRLDVELGHGTDLIRRLKLRELDLIFCGQPSPLEKPLLFFPMLTAAAIVAVAPGHPLAGQHGVTVERLVTHRLAGTNFAFRNTTLFNRPDDDPCAGAFMANDYEALTGLAIDGICALVAPNFVVAEHLRAGRLVGVDIDWRLDVTFGAVTTPSVALSPVAQSAIAIAQAIFDDV